MERLLREGPLDAYVLIQAEARTESLARALEAVPGVVSAEVVGGAYDVIALARARSTSRLLDEVVAGIREVPGVTRALPAPLIRSVSGRSADGPSEGLVLSGDRAA
jgi:DNA-binding Lrp family transcriptional regulator